MFELAAKFEVIEHFVALKVEAPHAKTAPPINAEFEVMVQLFAVMVEPPRV